MAGKRTQPAAVVAPVDVTEQTPAADVAPVETTAAPTTYETKVVVSEIRNRILDQQGNPVPVPVGHAHSWERGRRPDGSQVYRCACGEERPR